MATKAITDENFDQEVIKSEKPTVVDFWAEWCGPCKQIGPALEEISEEMKDQVIIAKHNIDNEPNTPTKYGIKGIPTMLLFKSGELKESELLEEASEMLEKMKKVPGMKNIDELLKKMGMPGGAGKMASGGKIDLGAMKNNLNKNLKNAKMRERMLQKLEENRKQKEEKVNEIINGATISDDKFSTGESVEKSLVISEPKKSKKKKKKKGGNKKK